MPAHTIAACPAITVTKLAVARLGTSAARS